MKTSKRGRPALDSAEILRRRIWYFHVISRTNRTHSELDMQFDLFLQNRISSSGPGKRRRKIWGDLRDKDLMPFKRDLQTFLALVDSDPEFNGTAKIYNSYLWRFFSKKTMSADELRKFILEILEYYDAFYLRTYKTQSKAPKIEPIFKSKMHDFGKLQGYIRNLQSVTNLITNEFDKLALYGALFREAYYNADIDLAFFLDKVYINKWFEIKASKEWVPETAEDLFDAVCGTRQFAHDIAVEKTYAAILKRAAKSTPAYNLLINEQED